jgi:gamma-glutamyl phosphate reductase
MSAWLNAHGTGHGAHQIADDLFNIARFIDANDSKAVIGEVDVE